jgi:hypothetical protein
VLLMLVLILLLIKPTPVCCRLDSNKFPRRKIDRGASRCIFLFVAV